MALCLAFPSGKGSAEEEQRRVQALEMAVAALPAMDALEVLLETARVLRREFPAFAAILLLLLCPVSAALLSDALVDGSLALELSRRAALLAVASGLPPTHSVERVCRHMVGALLSAAFCFPLLLTLLLLSRAAIAYSVACCFAGKRVLASEFFSLLRRIWRSMVSTYLFSCGATLSCLGLFLFLLIATCNAFCLMGSPPELTLCPALLILLAFSVAYAHVVIVCNLAGVISVLEDRSGMDALLRSVYLVRGQTQVGFLIFLASTFATASVEALLEHIVKSLGYIDEASGVWLGALLVLMYSAVVLVDSMMSAVFYFTCTAPGMQKFDGDGDGNHSSDELKLLSSWWGR